MARFYYTSTLSTTQLEFAELNSNFVDVTTQINTTKLSNDKFAINAGRYRHLKEPGSLFFYVEAEGTAIDVGGSSLTIATKDGSAWNRLHGCTVTYSPSLEYAGTSSEKQPIGYICAEYDSHNFSDAYTVSGVDYTMKGHNYQLCILYTLDGGSNWLEVPGTAVRFGQVNTHPADASIAHPLWTAKQKHPFTHVSSTYIPGSAYNHRSLFACAPIVGFGSTTHDNISSITGIDMWSVGIKAGDLSKQRFDSNATQNVHAFDKCRLWLVVEDAGV